MIRLILFFLLIPSLLFAGQGMGPGPGFKKYTASGAWYYSAGSDTYPNSDAALDTGDDFGSSITVGASGNITKIAMKVVTKGTSNFKILLETPGGTVQECQTIANASITNAAWNEVTLASPLAVTSSQVVKVWVTVDATGQSAFYYGSAGSGLFARGDTYANFCSTTTAGADVGVGRLGVRVYVN